MSDRITRKDLDNAHRAHVETLTRHDLIDPDAGRLVLNIGSKTYGNAYRLAWIPTGETGHYNPPIGGDFLGMTARDAYDRLTERTRTIQDVFWRLDDRNADLYGSREVGA